MGCHYYASALLGSASQQHVSDVAYCLCRVQPFRANRDTVLDTMTTEYAEGIIQI